MIFHLVAGLGRLPCGESLADKQAEKTDSDDEDDAEDDNDTSFPAGPVAALSDGGESLTGDDGLKSRHFDDVCGIKSFCV
jgi:hypothetical protein